ncbi:MAG TPA: hypothetical protein VFP59_03640 [Candidatus Angelobacter sp.]|nr:hypothetical protein [Candidatus Angelobacter sp.]
MNSIFSHFSVFAVVFSFLAFAPLYAQDTASAPQENANATAGRTGAIRQPPDPFKGFNAYEEFQGASTSSESIFKLDSSIGYDFNRYAGIFVGVPLYFVHDSVSSSAGNLSGRAAGDVYFGLDLYVPTNVVNYSTTFTIGAPTGSVSKGFSTGHRTLDWTSRLRRHFGRFVPFVSAGIGDTVPDTDLVTQTFTSLGAILHLEEGADYDLTTRFYAGADAYHILPLGNQQIVNREAGDATGRQRDGSVDLPSASGNNLIRENGFDIWLGFEPTRVLRFEAGYSRSVTFALNRLSFNIGLNMGRLLRQRRRSD